MDNIIPRNELDNLEYLSREDLIDIIHKKVHANDRLTRENQQLAILVSKMIEERR